MHVTFLQTTNIFFQFLWRDTYIYLKKTKAYLINYALIFPAIFSISIAYLQANIFFGPEQTRLGTIIFSGSCIIPLIVVAFHLTFELLFDLEHNRFVDYQISILSPRLVLFERILFASLFTFFVMIPFYPMAKLFAGSAIDMSNTSWVSLFGILYLGALCASSYHQLAACIINESQIVMFWVRVNFILIMFGGFWIPLQTMQDYSPALGYLVRLNPLLYLTEGIRQAIIGGEQFLSLAHCAGALFGFSVVFTILSWYFFKKRVDHI